MTDDQKTKIENLEQQEEKELTPEQSEQAEGGSWIALGDGVVQFPTIQPPTAIR
jgi:hypothetical protein